MTDRYYALTVVLERDIREDDAESLIDAIKMIRGVLDVTPHVSDRALHTAERRVRRDIEERLYAVLHLGVE